MAKITGFIVTAGHLDIEWYQPMRSYRFWTVEALEDLKTIAKTRDDFVTYCLDGQYYPLKEYLQAVPEDEPVMRDLIQKGLLTIGPFYTQYDEWLPSAESMIRNCLYGDRKCKEFGGYMRAGYLPDNFGHPLQLPQILRGFGLDSLLFMRGMPEVPGGHPDEFIYKGLDGSELFVSHFRESYSGAFDIFNKGNNPVQPRTVPYYSEYLSFECHRELADHDDPVRIAKSLIQNVKEIVGRYPTNVVPLIAGFDHLPPQINIGDSVKAANEMQDEIEFVMGDVQQYVELAQSRMQNPAVYDMELIGSMYQYVLLGALSTRTYLKRENFGCEALLERYAEPLDAIASLYGYPHKPALLDEAWEYIMVNSAHDSIHGSSLDEVHVEMQGRFAGARQIAAGIIHDAMKYCGQRLPSWGKPGEKEILTFAPVNAGKQAVELWLPVNTASFQDRYGAFAQPSELEAHEISILDKDGKEVPAQVLPREEIETNGIGKPRNSLFPGNVFQQVLFMDDFKAGELGQYRMLYRTPTAGKPLCGGDSYIENEFIRVDAAGSLITITDKRSGKQNFNLNLLEEDADAGDAWDYAPTWTPGELVRSTQFDFTSRLTECGNVRATLTIAGTLSVPKKLIGDNRSKERTEIPVTFEVSIYADTPRADVRLTFTNNACDHRIRLRVPTGIKTDFVRSQGHLAILDRPIARQREVEPWIQPPTQLLPCREWVAVEDGTRGLAIALKGLYDYEAVINPLNNEPDLYITLLRGFEIMGRKNTLQRAGEASMAHHTPGAQCPGKQVIEWAYVPYEADPAEKAPFLPIVQSFLYPAVGHMLRAPHEEAAIAQVEAPFVCREPNIQFSAFKKCYNGDGYVLRLFENQGKATTAEIALSPLFTKAELADMNETSLTPLALENGKITLDFAPYKAVTVKLQK